MRAFLVVFVAAAALVLPAGRAAAQSSGAQAIANELMSPFCPGKTLAVCTSPAAAELRAEIDARLIAGESPEAVVDGLVARFGDGIRGAPAARGFGLLAWLAPMVIGLLVLAAIRQVASRRSGTPAEPAGSEGPEWSRRLDDELAAMD
jgi:cytochrome c-type biogenesis protein CcmH